MRMPRGTRYGRGICGLCHQEWALTLDGRLRAHRCGGTPVTYYHQGGGKPTRVTQEPKVGGVVTEAVAPPTAGSVDSSR